METVALAVCDSPARFRTLVDQLEREPEIWIDTETADWHTRSPRLSLIQVRTPSGDVHVIDALADGMPAEVGAQFIPRVMASPTVRKWAHNASYERRFLGGEQVQNLSCTFELARSIPFHRLPLRSLSLAALARHFLGQHLDKSFQRCDWGVRPLQDDQLAYAAADPEICFRIGQRLQDLVRELDPAAEDPAALRARYAALLAELRPVESRRRAMRAAVLEFLSGAGRPSFGGFKLHRRFVRTAFLSDVAAIALAADPGWRYDLTFYVSRKLREFIGDGEAEARLRPLCRISVGRVFRAPRLGGRAPVESYLFDAGDPARADAEYAEVDMRYRMLRSEKEELRDRMKAWLGWQGLDDWEGFAFSPPDERWYTDVRNVGPFLSADHDYEIGLPKRFLLAFGPEHGEELRSATRLTPCVLWRETRAASASEEDVQETREWHEEEADLA